MSAANTGSSATAPPNSTANISSDSAASTSWLLKMNFSPLSTLSRRLSRSPSMGGRAAAGNASKLQQRQHQQPISTRRNKPCPAAQSGSPPSAGPSTAEAC